METRKNNLAVILIIVLIIGAVVGGIALTKANTSEATSEQTSNEPAENGTDMETLKASEYTNDAFDEVELGDTKADVEKQMGSLTKVDIESEYDVYSLDDDKTSYFFYFDGDKLADVSVFLA